MKKIHLKDYPFTTETPGEYAHSYISGYYLQYYGPNKPAYLIIKTANYGRTIHCEPVEVLY